METETPSILQLLCLSLMFGALALIVSWVAWGKGFFNLPAKEHKVPTITFSQVIVTYLIFISVYIMFAPTILHYLVRICGSKVNYINLIALLQLMIFVVTGFLLWVYGWSINRSSFQKIWKDRTFTDGRSLRYDMGIGAFTWLIAFPTVIVASELSEAITLLFFHELGKEQMAIQYLKLAIEAPFSFVVALITILVGAPFLEEYLFRGVLQTWIRNKLSPIWAITISSLAFSLFHLTPSQGVGNIALFFSLFTFALYLGFIYEKQRSLIANITLHVVFNFISVIRIITESTA